MTTAFATREQAVGKDKKKREDRQVTFRLNAELHSRLERAAENIALDISSLLRMMIREQLVEYERRGDAVLEKEHERESADHKKSDA